MKQYLSIVLRNQFNLFYRFGYTYVSNSQFFEFDGNINNTVNEQIVKLFETVTPFEYDQEYLILHLEKNEVKDSALLEFKIQDIVAIYPLSHQAKQSIESKIDLRIKLENPIFEPILPEIESRIEQKELKNAIEALTKICKINIELDDYISKIGLEYLFSGLSFRKNGTMASKIIDGNYYEYLIAYDRYEYFPNDILGYFYDAGEIFAYSKRKPHFTGSQLYSFLEKIKSEKPDARFLDIINYLENSEETKSYISQTTLEDVKLYIITPLYLMLRDEIRRSDDISQTNLFKNLNYLKKFGSSFNYVLILLGTFFGYRKFYDNYYESLNLRFYKDFKSPEESDRQVKSSIISETNKSNTIIIKDEVKKANEGNINEIKSSEENVNKQKDEIGSHNSNNNQTSKTKVIPDISSQCREFIEQSLNKQQQVKISEIAQMIKEKTGKKVNIGVVENVAKQMIGIEIIKKGRQAKEIRKGMFFKDSN